MLMTTRSARRRASSTSRKWPSWRNPIVGTNPTRLPRARAAPTNLRISVTRVRRCMSEAVLIIRIHARPYLVSEGRHGLANVVCEIRVRLEELRTESIVETQQVGQHEHLPVAADTRSNADRGDRDAIRHPPRDGGGHELEDECEGAR